MSVKLFTCWYVYAIFCKWIILNYLFVSGVEEDSSVEECSVNISNHGADVSEGVWGRTILLTFDVFGHRLIPELSVSFIAGVDLASLRNSDVRVSQKEFTQGGIKCVPINSATTAKHELCSGTINAVSSCDHLSTASKIISSCWLFSFLSDSSPDTEDGTNRYISINVRWSI